MDQTQKLEDSFLGEEDEVEEERASGKEREPLAMLRVFSNKHFPETEFPLFLGDNVLGRDPTSCSLPLSACSVSKQHAVISLSLLRGNGRHGDGATEALLWDLGSMNGTRKGRLRLTPQVRYALSEGESVVIADLPCQYVRAAEGGPGSTAEAPAEAETGRGGGGGRGKLRRIVKGCVSDSDSEGEVSLRTERRAKLFAPDSDSPRESSFSCSTFLTPTSRFVPDSEEDSSITPASSGRRDSSKMGKTPKHVSDSDPDEEEASGCRSGVDSAAKKGNSHPSVTPSAVGPGKKEAEFEIHDSESDTDAEGEEPAGNVSVSLRDSAAVVLQTGPSAGPVARPLEFHLDSDTDVEEEEEPAPTRDQNSNAKAPAAAPAVQQTEFHLDSDTDTEDRTDDRSGSAPGEGTSPPKPVAVKPLEILSDSDTDTEDRSGSAPGEGTSPPKPVAMKPLEILSDQTTNAKAPSAAPAVQRTEFHLDSDTDTEDHTEDQSGSAPGEGTSPPKPVAMKALEILSDSDTDAEEADAKPEPPPATSALGLEILSDSGSDTEDGASLPPCAPAAQRSEPRTAPLGAPPPAAHAVSESDTDLEEGDAAEPQPPAKPEVDPQDFNLDSDTDVEEEEGSAGPAEGPASSTPRASAVPEEELETKAFISASGPFRRRARASSAHGRKEREREAGEEATGLSVQETGRRKQAAALKKKEEDEEEEEEEAPNEEEVSAPSSEEQDVPRTPTGRNVRKRTAPSESPTAAKTPRRSVSCEASPGGGGRSKGFAQAFKVLFTGVTDPAGEAVVARLGGSMAKGVNDMTHLVTDKVRRTVKFLCAVARGVPIVTTDWLEKSGKRGSFLPPSEFLVKDAEQERKFSFRLEQSLCSAHAEPLLQGYEIHVTRSVKPEPAQMKDIISSSGARYLPKMPTVLKPQTVVVSCVEDASLCAPALSASIPVVSAEFLLTGILQQRADPVAHALSGPAFLPGAKAGARGKRK
ncbi:mediator of DNA damage checkpoint protein 1 isoform X2 [Conger conger]|uniref:mediator of DNA damage checkpoint protein 1 isoform X2 n=1 Tax=Conger conger TaxID=82655 RepID=UPI002A5A9816|nr:mediator of DNA damage checkpoint protein 1 isoform X2 [Conger conger]